MLEKDLDFYTRHGVGPNPQWEPVLSGEEGESCQVGNDYPSTIHISICIYIYIWNPNDPLFWLEKALFWRVDLQK